jgi:DNA-binding NtrC family response regulator
MFRKANFLLINGIRERRWRKVLEEALAPLGTLQVGEEKDAVEVVLQQSYDVVVVDATVVKDVPLLVSRIRAQQPDARIVVATASPTWRRAREAFYAGATDYIRKSLNKEEILSAFQAALAKTPLPWPR